MQTIKTEELIGAALDWAVAQVEIERDDSGLCFDRYHPSADWAIGGPIIQREMLGLMPVSDAAWRAADVDGANGFGEDPLIAAMRCYVHSTLGSSLEIPDELAQRAASTTQGEGA